MKICPKCNTEKAPEQFSKSKQTRDGLQGHCRSCKSAYYKADIESYKARHAKLYGEKRNEIRARCGAYYEANRERMQATARKRYERLPEHEKAKIAAKAIEFDRAFPGQARARSVLRRLRQKQAAPAWMTDEHRRAINDVYDAAQILERLCGGEYHVDHIVPIRGRTVCGLHVPWNLQILSAKENVSKSNRYWPDKP